ncbi:hypothetical protein HUU40_29065 [candidate division KSB1 bacterium]|nr:hypothetical protein [candidate division KSB1 bacterium]
MSIDDFAEHISTPISDIFRTLPLFDNPYIWMQALNLSVVDEYLMGVEQQLLDEYIELERTPFETAVFVSALSQIWIFGLYELLRTWRQRVSEILGFVEELAKRTGSDREELVQRQQRKINTGSINTEGVDLMHWRPFDLAANDPEFVNQLSNAVDCSERVFRRIEALRVSLAKHEVPKSNCAYAMAPGYGRIDMINGSIYWQIILRGNEFDRVSRRRIADEFRELAQVSVLSILPKKIQAKLRDIQEYGYGMKRIAVILEDGTEYNNVYVSWNKEIISVDGFESIPFDVTKVVDIRAIVS